MKNTLLEKVKWNYNPVYDLNATDESVLEVYANDVLSLKAKGLYSYMRSKPNGWDFSAKRIAEENKDGRGAILAAMKELEDSGYLQRTKRGDGRVVYVLSSNAYVGIEPRIDKSRLEGIEVDMNTDSFYDGRREEFKNTDGTPKTIGEPIYDWPEDKPEIVSVDDATQRIIDAVGLTYTAAMVSALDWQKSCQEGNIPQNEHTLKKWIGHVRRA
jgi:hypothetical protein